MEWLARQITGHRKGIVIVTLVLVAALALCALGLRTNNNMADYLPEDAESTIALKLMEEEFSGAMPNARVMVSDVTVAQAQDYKARLMELDGVQLVMWLDDVADLKEPLETLDPATVQAYYRDGTALFAVAIETGREVETVEAIYALDDAHTSISGDAAGAAFQESLGDSETARAMLILVPMILAMLLLTTTSWFEPVLYLGAIGVAIVVNLGVTALTGEISYVTMAVAPILQLAVSLDYAIFLLHSFEKHRQETDDVCVAMQRAIRSSFSSVAASAATTLFGFLALLLMKFRIGPDMGRVLVQGIVFSYLSVMVFLPALTLCCFRVLDRTRHRRFVPELKGADRVLRRVRIPALILAALLVVPCYLAQSRTSFFYGNGTPSTESRYGSDTARIDALFGQDVSLVVLVPRGEPARELALCRELEQVENVGGVTAYATMVGAAIPPDYLESAIVQNFYGEHYARIILSCNTEAEGDEAFAVVQRVRDITAQYYDESYTCGQSANLYDMKVVVSSDNTVVNLAAVLAIALTLLVTFRSLTLPLILLSVIETAIWINASIPYFTDTAFSYIGYLVINTVQLGATIDYAILTTDGYMQERRRMGKRAAVAEVLRKHLLSVLVSVLTLSLAGFCLYFTSSNVIVSSLGLLLGRGTLLSCFLVLCVLPALLMLFDRAIGKTTKNAGFLEEHAWKGAERP